MSIKRLTFSETMEGVISPYRGYNVLTAINTKDFHFSKDNASDLRMDLDIDLPESDLLWRTGRITGTIAGQVYSKDLGINEIFSGGEFKLFYPSEKVNVDQEMSYTLRIETENLGSITFVGKKFIQGDKLEDLWQETTSLYVGAYLNDDLSISYQSPDYIGLMNISMVSLLKMLMSFRNPDQRLSSAIATSKFVAGFTKSCFKAYKPKPENSLTLSNSLTDLDDHEFDVVVVGSGYGGSISANRLAEKGYKVALLERGKEYQPGDFPDDLKSSLNQVQVNGKSLNRDHAALFDLRNFSDVAVIMGCGLGGTSLINANVVVRPDPQIFLDTAWPEEFRSESTDMVPYYERVEKHLNVSSISQRPDLKKLAKRQAFERYSIKHDVKLDYPPLAVNFDVEGVNKYGATQQACISCGNCCSGCNLGAKNTLDKNYIPLAKMNGAKVFTGIEVSHFDKVSNNNYIVYYWKVREVRKSGKGKDKLSSIRCQKLVIASGALGSPEILMKSSRLGNIKFSSMLGKQVSVNGGTIGWIYNSDETLDAIGFQKSSKVEHREKKKNRSDDFHQKERRKSPWKINLRSDAYVRKVGPTITSLLDYRQWSEGDVDGFVIEDSSVPGLLSPLLPWLILASTIKFGKNPGEIRLRSLYPIIQSLLKGSYHGAINRSFALLGVGYDGQRGQMFLPEGNDISDLLNQKIQLSWPSLKHGSWYEKINQEFEKFQSEFGGVFVDYKGLGIGKPISVHPLGGCRMGGNFNEGVVNHACEVFSPDGGLHEGLYVCDGSVVPVPAGTNPLLLISSLTERAMDMIPEVSVKPIPTPSLESDKIVVPPIQYDSRGIKKKEQFSLGRCLQGFFAKKPTDSFDMSKAVGTAKIDQYEYLSSDRQKLGLTLVYGKGSSHSWIFIPCDFDLNIKDLLSGFASSMTNSLLNLGYNIAFAETRMSQKYYGMQSSHSFDHVVSYDYPVLIEKMMSLTKPSSLFYLGCGFANLPLFMYMSQVNQTHNIVSIGVSLIPRVSPIWKKVMTLGRNLGSHSNLLGPNVPGPYYRHLQKCIESGYLCRFHDRKDDNFTHICQNIVSSFKESEHKVLFIAGQEDHFFGKSQREAFSILDDCHPDRHSYRSIPGYNYVDLISSQNWYADIGLVIDLFYREAVKYPEHPGDALGSSLVV